MFKLEWVNHASYIYDDGEIRLITDPWLEGSVFNDSWDLISETKFTYQQFENIDYIWFSHEHPDHFFPPNLKKIPEEFRSKITILFQKTDDKKVAGFCEKLGFKEVKELDREFYDISKNTSIYVAPFSDHDTDSWIYLKYKDTKLLNVNDCVLNDTKLINKVKKITGEVDYLFTQFSYANWVGNPDDEAGRRIHAVEKFNRIKNQISIFKPKFIIPFASFVYFSKKANFFMNSTINTIEGTLTFLKQFNCKCLLFYPGDVYSGSSWDKNEINLTKYKKDLESKLSLKNLNVEEPCSLDFILRSLKDGPYYNFNLKSIFALALIKLIGTSKVLILLDDIDKKICLNLEDKIIEESLGDSFDICMSSQNLNYLLRYSWGPGTILIAGTFYTRSNNGLKFIHFMSEISHAISQGKKFDFPYVSKRILNLVKNKLNRIIDKLFTSM